jgi:predicted Ser/Thr protein kinase
VFAHGVGVSGDAHDVGLDATAPAPAAPRVTVETAPPAALEHTLAQGSVAAQPRAVTAAPATATVLTMRGLYLGAAALGAANIAYFVWRFLVSGSAPALHPVFQAAGTSTDLGVSFLRGPLVTLASISLVAIAFLVISVWVTRHHRRDPTVQLMGALAVVGGQLSISVTLLTSADTFVPARVLAACVYVLVPLAAFVTLALFPSGRPVPRWSLYLVPLAVVPYVLQARLMFVERGYSIVLAGAPLPVFLLFMGFQRHRYVRRATLREQHQIKWLCYAGAVFVAIQVVAIAGVLPLLADPTRAAFPVLKLLYSLLVAGSYLVGLACLLLSAARYRVWDIDRLINRSVVYTLVTGVLAAAFVVAFFAVRQGLEVVDAPRGLAAGLAFAAAALLFPLTRRRMARWIDRRFYGIGLDYEAIATKAVRAAALPTLGTEIGPFDGLVLLGRGGMGAVYRAHHADFGVPVALKVMSPALAGDAGAEARFQREARVLEGLRHPHVVPFLASGHERGLAFIAMQYVDGEDLGSLVRRRGRLPLAEVATIISGIAEALDLAHERGVVHRDIKPANVFLEHGDPEHALVMDFGVARLAGDPPLAGDDSLVGSLPYTSPEQIQHADRVDGRADIYSLGATAFELLCGRPPFRESTALGYVMAHLRQIPPDARELEPSLPAHIAAALSRALAKLPDLRFATAGELAAALRAPV